MPRPRRPGRPRDQATQAAILAATRRLLLESGYHRLTFEAVASAAGTSRSTVYRWWPTRGSLVLEAAADHIDIGRVPDTGDSRQDLRIAIRQLIETFSDRLAGIVILAAVANLDGDATMATAFRDSRVYPWRTSAADALRRAIERGDLPPDTDVQFVLNVIVGTVFQCTITPATPMTDGLEDALLDLVFAGRTDAG
ncbi:MAG TPA: TetR/AcrR family transcriptional regulator [Candidatus Limnocylindrales bacterium]|nr:TetR/AcrR family transcriptional regulator [Candidatus Limnocylindrales bacterium]